jgi:predicted small metal-binding protein
MTDAQLPGLLRMKILTCRELGGECDQPLSANSWEEMLVRLMKHIDDNHSDLSQTIDESCRRYPDMWSDEIRSKFNNAPEHQSPLRS